MLEQETLDTLRMQAFVLVGTVCLLIILNMAQSAMIGYNTNRINVLEKIVQQHQEAQK